MRKITILLLILLSLSFITVLPIQAKEDSIIYDEVGVLSSEEYEALTKTASKITEKYACDVRVAIFSHAYDSQDPYEFAKNFYRENGLGYGDDKSGIMFYIVLASRDCGLVAHGYGNTAFTDYGKDILLDDHILPFLSQDDYFSASTNYLEKAEDFLKLARAGTPFDVSEDYINESNKRSSGKKWAITIISPLLIAGLVSLVLLGQMKTAVPQKAADFYITKEGLKLTAARDRYLYRKVQRTRIQQSSSSSSNRKSSGGTTSGSDGFSGKSRKF